MHTVEFVKPMLTSGWCVLQSPGALFVNPGPSVSCICHENNSYYIIDNKRELLSLHAALLRVDIWKELFYSQNVCFTAFSP